MVRKWKPRNYTTVSIPLTLMERVDVALKKGGYKNRSDFILDAIRKRLRELGIDV